VESLKSVSLFWKFTILVFILFVVAIILGIYILGFSGLRLETKMGAVRLVIAGFGFPIAIFGGLLAAYSFSLAQRGPDLELAFLGEGWPQELDIERPADSGDRLYFIRLVMRNRADTAGEFVKIEVDFGQLDPAYRVRLREESRYEELWDTIQSPIFFFVGGRDFIIHPHDEEVFGIFSIHVSSDGPPQEFPIHYRIRAQRMDRRDGHLTIRVNRTNR